MKKISSIIKFMKNSPKFTLGVIFVLIIVIFTVFAPIFTQHNPTERYRGEYHMVPTWYQSFVDVPETQICTIDEHAFGTTRLGRDVLAQTLYGGRHSLMFGTLAAVLTTVIAMVVGISAGYIGGVYDNVVSTITNILMVIPTMVLLLIITAMTDGVNPLLISLIIGFTSWPWGSRVLRAQTMSIRNRDFVRSAETLGENKFRILFVEIMPNMLSMISSSFVGQIIYSVMAQATLEFIGFGDPNSATWGIVLYNARNSGAFKSGYWFEVIGTIGCLVILGMGLTLINFAIDEISNPKLKAQRIMKNYYKARKIELRKAGGK